MEYYKKENKIAVLVAEGAGWSTWNSYGIALAIDKRIVELFIEKRDSSTEMVKIASGDYEKLFETWGYKDVYFGGFDNLTLQWVDEDDTIFITECAGEEILYRKSYGGFYSFKEEEEGV